MQRNVFKKQVVAPMQNPVEKKIGKSNKINSSNSPFATSLMCINDMNVSVIKNMRQRQKYWWLLLMIPLQLLIVRKCRPGNHCSHATFDKMFGNNR